MLLYQLCRLFCLLFLGLNVAAAAINPSSIIVPADNHQPDSQLPTTLPNAGDGPVTPISPPEPRMRSEPREIYHEYGIAPDVKDADRAKMDSLDESAMPDSALDFDSGYWPLLRLCAYVTVVSCIVKVAREVMK